jgi:transmembrane sensor
MMEREPMNDSQELPAQVQRAAALIRNEVDVRWPAGHVEIALIQLQRRRHQRRTAALGMTLSVAGVALVLALGFRGYLRDELVSRGLAPSVSPPPASVVVDSLAAGLPPAPAASAPAAVVARAAEPPAPRAVEGHLLQQRLVPRRQVAAARWMALAGEKRFGEAYGLLRQVPLRELSDPDDLMLAADVARQAGRSERAVPFLERVVREHPNEVSAQLAGFSLGKVYLDNLGEPALAARAFAAVRAMAPGGGLAQDALAREVEAWARAGDKAQARDVATEYARLYPHGRRLAAVRDLGGI